MTELVADGEACKVYGALSEGVHVAGYTIERAWQKLEWLLEGNRWRQLGVEFRDVNAFLDSIKLDNLRIVADQRKRIADRIRALQPEVSNKQIARTLGVSDMTIGRDIATNVAPASENTKKINEPTSNAATNVAIALSGAAVAKLAERAEKKGERRQQTRAARRQMGEKLDADTARLILADFRDADIEPESIDCVLTDPPYEYEAIPLYGELARAAAAWLRPGGSLAVMCGQSYLLDFGDELRGHGLRYHHALAYLTPGGQSVQLFDRNVNVFWKPVLWFIKGKLAARGSAMSPKAIRTTTTSAFTTGANPRAAWAISCCG